MEEKIQNLERRVVELEKHIQEQPTLKEIINSVATEIKNSVKSINRQ